MVVPVAFGSRQKLVKRNVDHDSGHCRQTHRIDRRRPEGKQERRPRQSPYRFGKPRKQRVAESQPPIPCTVMNRHEDGYSFGNVVDRYGHNDGKSHVQTVEGRDERDRKSVV